MRTPEEIAAIIDRYNLADRDALRELEAHIRRELPIREILLFADFLHDGDFISSSGKWRRNSSGYVTQTNKEDAALTCLWEGLARSAHFYIGAASVLKMQNARLFAGYAFADEGDGPTLYDYTLDALVRAVPKEYHKQLDAASRLDDIKKTAVETRQGVGVLVSKLPDAKKPTIISWAEATEIFMPGVFIKRGDQFVRPEEERKNAVENFSRNCRNWLKAGIAGRSGLPITRDNLATTNIWKKWVEAYVVAERKATIVSERAGKVEAEKSRRRSPTA